MGVIYGIIEFENRGKAMERGLRIGERIQNYTYDYVGSIEDQGLYFGCGLIYNTPESQLEKLPRRSSNSRFILTADAIIDNREELFLSFGLDKSDSSTITDSELIVRAYEKWGYDCPKYLIGDYAFAIWDKERKELYCTRDPLGTRTLYFTCTENMFAFCTIEKPLLGLTGEKPELNEKWLTGFLSIDGIQHELDYRETVYRDIFQLLPANYAIVNVEGVKQVQYWDLVKNTKPVRFKTDEEYVEAFNKIFSEAVACRLRSAGEVAIMLSGGMDSGAIACVAAKRMEKTDRKLHAFSSIPVKSFDEVPDKRTIYNEVNEIELVAQAYSNINVSYCSFEEANALSDIDKLIGIFEQPYKVFQNMTWYRPMLQSAADKNCKIMLIGQSGNGTISYGDFRMQLLTLYRSGNLVAVVQEIHALSRLLNLPLKKVYKLAKEVITPYRLRKWRDHRHNKGFDRFQNVVVNQMLVKKWDIEKALDQIDANAQTLKNSDYGEENEHRVSQRALTHIAAVETKLSLDSRITIRDPSRDRRVVEFCLSIPSDQYVKNGSERNLLKRAMKGILPDDIRTNKKTRGLQSADWMHRLKPVWHRVVEELDVLLEDEQIKHYLDENKLQELRATVDDCLVNKDANATRLVLIAIIFSRFINDFNQFTTNEAFE